MVNNEGPARIGQPSIISGHWVIARTEVDQRTIRIHLSISESPDEPISASDVIVDLLADVHGPYPAAPGIRLPILSCPEPALPLSGAFVGGTTAFADYEFDNSDRLVPHALQVQIKGETSLFAFPQDAPG